ncbi:MAG: hypothetical protein KAY65_13850, partial [Planctomycetes bacterium]|nr:hypothetical protein [Planctomycetota bacterium]
CLKTPIPENRSANFCAVQRRLSSCHTATRDCHGPQDDSSDVVRLSTTQTRHEGEVATLLNKDCDKKMPST